MKSSVVISSSIAAFFLTACAPHDAFVGRWRESGATATTLQLMSNGSVGGVTKEGIPLTGNWKSDGGGKISLSLTVSAPLLGTISETDAGSIEGGSLTLRKADGSIEMTLAPMNGKSKSDFLVSDQTPFQKPKVIWDWPLGASQRRIILSDMNTRDIWSTSVYSYTGGGGGPGGGKEDERLRVGGYGDFYVALIEPPLVKRLLQSPKRVRLSLFTQADDGAPTPFTIEAITAAWGWKEGDRLWWKDLPQTQRIAAADAPSRESRVEIDITSIYQSWLQDPSSQHGILLRPMLNQNNYDNFASTRAAEIDKRPILIIDY